MRSRTLINYSSEALPNEYAANLQTFSNLVSPSAEEKNSNEVSCQMPNDTMDLHETLIANDSIDRFPTTGSEKLVSFLNNMKVAKFKDIQGSYHGETGYGNSLDANKNGKNFRRAQLDNPKERNTNNRKKKRALPDTTEKQPEVEVVSIHIDVYNSLKTERNSTKRVCYELCDTIVL